jgi:CDP-paratose 2-epimerase
VRSALVTGSSGLIGSEMVVTLDRAGWVVHGVDNNMRRDFFGPDGDTTPNLRRLQASTQRFDHHEIDVRDREGIARLVGDVRPQLIVHCAAQPSHDLAARRPYDDFDVNAGGTLNLLEAARTSAPENALGEANCRISFSISATSETTSGAKRIPRAPHA